MVAPRPREEVVPRTSGPCLPVIEQNEIIALQPVPVHTRTVRFQVMRWWITAIMRNWNKGDSARCKLCPKCHAYDDGCLIVLGRKVEDGDAPLATAIALNRIKG